MNVLSPVANHPAHIGATSGERPRGARRVRPASAAAGFTLIEVLLATVLLAAGLALVFTTLRAASASVQRGEVRASASDGMRAVAAFLRRGIGGARPLAFARDPVSQQRMVFIGEPQRMRFVADLPDYLGHGGAYLHDLRIEQVGEHRELLAGLAIVLGGEPQVEADPRPPERLAEGLRQAGFRYRGLTADGALGEWSDRWGNPQVLPVQVEVTLVAADGRPWPTLVIALPLAGAQSQANAMPTQ